MSRLRAAQKTWKMCRRLQSQRGGSVCAYFADAVRCSFRHGASPENYFVLRFYQLDEKERSCFLTSGRSKDADARLNRGATAEDRRSLARKEVFLEKFSGLVKRNYLYVPQAGLEQFRDFALEQKKFLAKPPSGTMGHGIELLDAGGQDMDELYHHCRERGLLLEEKIIQHPDLAAINPSSVNTLRINAARDRESKVRLIGACLKCGGPGAVTDNFHSGGVAYPVDMETGQVSGPGRNNRDIKDFFRHPGTDVYMPGIHIPFWHQVVNSVYAAMDMVPSLGYVGWDIAVTAAGPELVEGNYSWPGGNIIQFDNVGKYPLILECLGDADEKHNFG